jgi:hypothetical protein
MGLTLRQNRPVVYNYFYRLSCRANLQTVLADFGQQVKLLFFKQSFVWHRFCSSTDSTSPNTGDTDVQEYSAGWLC